MRSRNISFPMKKTKQIPARGRRKLEDRAQAHPEIFYTARLPVDSEGYIQVSTANALT
jgi:hypothetical protein